MTYFAVNQANSALITQTLVEAVIAHPEWHWMALIDGAFDGNAAPFAQWPEGEPTAIGGQAVAVGEWSGPYLLALPTWQASEVWRPAFELAVQALIEHCSGRPMLSFVAASDDGAGLAAKWAPGMEVNSAEEGEFVLRFADTRVLPVLNQPTLQPVWQAIAGPLHAWLYINRQGGLGNLVLADGNIPAAGPVDLSEAGLETLLRAGLADAVIDIVAEQLPELVNDEDKLAFYDRVAALCRVGRDNGVDSLRDIVALVTIGLITEGALIKDPRLYAILAGKAYEPGELMEQLVTLLE